jgi:hypothetical protein
VTIDLPSPYERHGDDISLESVQDYRTASQGRELCSWRYRRRPAGPSARLPFPTSPEVGILPTTPTGLSGPTISAASYTPPPLRPPVTHLRISGSRIYRSQPADAVHDHLAHQHIRPSFRGDAAHRGEVMGTDAAGEIAAQAAVQPEELSPPLDDGVPTRNKDRDGTPWCSNGKEKGHRAHPRSRRRPRWPTVR